MKRKSDWRAGAFGLIHRGEEDLPCGCVRYALFDRRCPDAEKLFLALFDALERDAEETEIDRLTAAYEAHYPQEPGE